MTIQSNIRSLADHVKTQVKERDEVVDGIFTAMLSGHHVVQLGSPGEAKSLIARLICDSLVDSAAANGSAPNEYFEWLLTRFSVPEEIFGKLSLKSLERDDLYIRKTEGKLPSASIAFLDEIFKANSAILNSLLTVLNEGIYHNGDAGQCKVPLLACIAASNEYPEDDCAALWDRFLVRFWVEPVRTEKAFLEIVDPGGSEPSALTGLVSVSDIEKARDEVAKVEFSDEMLKVLHDIREAMKQIGVERSTRRWRQAAKYVRARAFFDGDKAVNEDTFMCLVDVLWSDHKERPAIKRALQRICNPVMVEATEFFDALSEIHAQATIREGEDAVQYGVRAGRDHEEMMKVYRRLQKLQEGNAKRKSLADLVSRGKAMVKDIRTQALSAVGML